MPTIPKYDVIVVGSGPAGALLGYHLAGAGVNVLILEKKTLPRYKACGGGLTARALARLPFDVTPLIEDYTVRPRMLYQYRTLYHAPVTPPVIGMVMRDQFDHHLVQRAEAAGAAVQDGTAFNTCRGVAGDLTIDTDKGSLAAKLLVGADGVESRVGRCLGLTQKKTVMTALEGECYFRQSHVVDRFKGSAHFDFGVIPGGYGWVFPKKDHLSIGIGTWFRPRNLTAYFQAYLNRKGLGNGHAIKPFKGHTIPCGPMASNRRACRRGLVVGDAAAFTDPITGEGIVYALAGAELAARSVLRALDKGYESLSRYDNEMNAAFFKEIVCAQRIARAIYHVPRLGRWLLSRHGLALGQAQIDVAAGHTSYQVLFKKILLWVISGRIFYQPP
jgi:geranylgeranyl reductase family protein